MPKLIWSPQALLDVQRAFRFLGQKNVDAAKRAAKAVRASVRIIAQHPEVGRPVEEVDPDYREWLIDFGDSGYVILYRHNGQTAVILAVHHQKEVGYGV